jgi:sugar/nucleoside kinase (ribokinase family)
MAHGREMIWVVGAVAIDMIAVRERFLEGTSNPSDIRLGLGGVGYRIFSNLETPRKFITALAGDPISKWAREALEADGEVAIQDVKGRNAGPPLYLALMESGSLKVAASDFRIVEQALSAEFVSTELGDPGPDDFVVLDANLSPQLLAALVRRYAERTRVVFEPVSVEKASRHADALRSLFLLTPTVEEIEALADADIPSWMAVRSISRVLVTRGGEGATLYQDGTRTDFSPSVVVHAGDTTGAGDLLLAALLSRLHRGEDMAAAVRAAMLTVEDRLQKGAL